MTGTCGVCFYWTQPLHLSWPHRPKPGDKLGRCNGTTYDLFEVSGPDGCSECAPYSDKELLTAANFGCVAFKPAETKL